MTKKLDKIMTSIICIIFILVCIIFILVFVVASIFSILDRIDMGCWNFKMNNYEGDEYFFMGEYSCEEFREMFLLDVYPTEIKKITSHHLCNGEIEIMWKEDWIEKEYYGEGDYKNEYKNKCLENKQSSH